MSNAQRRPRKVATDLRDGELFAALDLGSNSFHMVVARNVLGQLRIVDRLRETVRLAEGLDAKGGLDKVVRNRALECLARFGQRISDLPAQRVRAVATNTVRQLNSAQSFLIPAEAALGHAIEVVSGREEARLIYLGVAHAQPPKPKQSRLVIDIGGGSTECIIGSGFDARERESLQAGCVASTRRFFANGKLSRKRWRDAAIELEAEFQQFAARYRSVGWDEVLGASGTIKAIGGICAALKLTKGAINTEALLQVRDRILEAGEISRIDLPELSDERRPVIAGGVLVLEATFEVLGLQLMTVSKAALREGVLHDMLGRGGVDDPRETSVAALMQRYAVEPQQAARVETTALHLFDQVAEVWSLDTDARQLLAWAARLHEVGLAIAHSQYHLHSTYVLANSDIAGFSVQDQRFLAALVRAQRRRISKSIFEALPDRLLPAAKRCAALLRLAVLLHRSQESAPLPPELRLTAEADTLRLFLPKPWLEQRPLLRADLLGETQDIAGLDVALQPFAD